MRPVYRLGVFIPIALALDAAGASATVVFVTSAVAIVPIAALMGDATEQLAARSGPGLGGLVNVTFGNAPELIIAVFALADGLQEVVKASIVGSVVGNALLVLGAAMVAGGWGRTRQTFDRTLAQTQSGMLLLTVVALTLPATIVLARHGALPGRIDQARVVRRRHRRRIRGRRAHSDRDLRGRAVLLPADASRRLQPGSRRRGGEHGLAGAPVGAHARRRGDRRRGHERGARLLDRRARQQEIGLSPFFVGAFVVAIVGNASEHYVAVLAAARDKMSLAVTIAVGSSAQVGLFVAPVLVLASYVVGPAPMAMVFNPYEIAALLVAGIVTTALVSDGETTWFEGVQLLALYAVLGVIFFVA